jgi:hypothetical protein
MLPRSVFLPLILIITILLIWPSSTYGQGSSAKDRVFFANGDISSGTLKAVKPDAITFQGDLTGTVDYKWADIDHVDVMSHDVSFVNGTGPVDLPLSRKVPYTVTLKAGTLRLDPLAVVSAPEDQTAPKSKVATVPNFTTTPPALAAAPPPAKKQTVSPWSGALSSQDSVTQATQDNYQLGASLHTVRETQGQTAWNHQQLSIDAQASFSEASKPGASPVRTALYKGSLQNNFFLNSSALKQNFPNRYDSFYFFPFAEAYHNLSLGINVQQSYGVGFGWQRQVNRKPNLNGDQLMQLFGFNADLRYSHQDLYSPGSTYDLAATGLSENYTVVIPVRGPKPFEFYERISVIPSFNVTRALETRGSAGFNVPLTCRVSIGPKVIDDYFRNAPHTSKQNYLQPSLSLTFSFNALPPTTANRCNPKR